MAVHHCFPCCTDTTLQARSDGILLQPSCRLCAGLPSIIGEVAGPRKTEGFTRRIPQVVLGVLGCPNLPREPIADADAGAEAAGHAGDSDVGVIFAARRGGGAHVGPLKSGAAAFHSGRHVCWQ